MTRIEALTQLAEKVMGATIRRRSEGRVIVADFPDGSHYYIQHHEAGPQILTQWNPFTDPAQALKLLEAWLGLGKGRWYEHEGLRQNLHRVYLFIDFPETDPCSGEATTFSKAAFDAVCAAEGNQVKE